MSVNDHLGNVRVVISDRKLLVEIELTPDNKASINDYYAPEVVSYSDYYAFGMLQPDRHYVIFP